MKRLTALVLFFTMLFALSAECALILEYDGGKHEYNGSLYKLKVNGKYVKTPLEPIIMNDRALVPVREVFEAMGAEVGYSGASREITVSSADIYILLKIGSDKVFVNGSRVTIPDGVVPMLIAKQGESAKTMVPVRFVSESLGMNVFFDGPNGEIKINNPAQNFYEEAPSPTPVGYTSEITDVRVEDADNGLKINVKFDKKPEKVGKVVYVESSQVVYVDVDGADCKVNNISSTGQTLVKAVRIGKHDGYTRIAIDTNDAEGFKRSLSSDGKQLTIEIYGESEETEETPKPSASAKPSPTPGQSDDSDATPAPKPSPTPTPKPTPTPQAHITGEKIVVIDAGHGGSDPGASYTHNDVKYIEKEINLAVAQKVKEILKDNGIRVEMTRDGDTYPTLTDRSDFANKLGASMFVSIHSNAAAEYSEASGIEVYYSETNNTDRYGIKSKTLASDIYKNMIKNTGAKARGVKTAQHVVTRTSEMPAVLIELGFLTNVKEAENLLDDSYRDLLASAIAAGVLSNIEDILLPPKPIEKKVEAVSDVDEKETTEGETQKDEN